MKSFIFLYPIPEIINFEIERFGSAISKERYKETLNQCIDLRYRQKGFEINYAIFSGHKISDIIKLKPNDKIIDVGLDFKTHTTKQTNGEYPYPDQDHILNQLNYSDIIRIAGFHMWDCVEKLAKKAYEMGLDTLVDEDLTEFFSGRLLFDGDFKVDEYPTYNARKKQGHLFDIFMKARKNKPWLWQEY